MTGEIDFAGPARSRLARLGMEPLALDADLAHVQVEGGEIRLDVFRAPKIDKIVFCDIRLRKTGVVERSLLAWPDDRHHLPALWCNLTIVPGVMNVPACDFIPMIDLIVWPDYAAAYIQPLAEQRQKALETFGETVLDKAVDLPSLSARALSPYKLTARITDSGLRHVPEVTAAYADRYVTMVSEAKPVPEGDSRDFYLRKKAAVRALMKANDPGYPFMVAVFGEAITRRVLDWVF